MIIYETMKSLEISLNNRLDMGMGKRKIEIDFIRCVCAIGIIVYHFYCHSNCSEKIFYSFANGLWGDVIVSVFFMISGAVLFLNNSEVKDWLGFYKKRWKSIFPDFYIIYSVFFC